MAVTLDQINNNALQHARNAINIWKRIEELRTAPSGVERQKISELCERAVDECSKAINGIEFMRRCGPTSRELY